MIRNVSYNNKEISNEINDLIGKPFGVVDRIKMRGIGSQRLLITDASPEIKKLLKLDNNTNHCNIELRSRGIIVRFRSILNTFGWAIPYYKLNLFKNADHFAIYADSDFIRIQPAHNERFDDKYFRKMMELKAAYFHLISPMD